MQLAMRPPNNRAYKLPRLSAPIECCEGEEERDDPNTLPAGFKFCPTDQEIIVDYLTPKVRGLPLPCEGLVIDADVYQHSPKTLIEEYADEGHDGMWYFFTPRNRKYMKGKRPDRAAAGGYWKATVADKVIRGGEKKSMIGTRKSLVFYKTCTRNRKSDPGTKTKWMMVEYKIGESSKPVGSTRVSDGRWQVRVD